MIATAYVLIAPTSPPPSVGEVRKRGIESGKARKVYDQPQKISNVTHISAVTGPYDLIVTIQSTDFLPEAVPRSASST